MAHNDPQLTTRKRSFVPPGAWQEARALVYAHRYRVAFGLVLMLISRLAGLVLPWMSGYVVDDVIAEGRGDLLVPLALAAAGATVVQSGTGFALSQVLGVAAQRAITEMRKRVQRHVTQLPIGYFDGTQAGALISRVMTDAEGIRNLVGTGLTQLLGAFMTATLGLGVLFYLNWRLTAVTLCILVVFGVAMAMAFTKLRPLFRERGKINAEVTGRLAETLGGVRIVKAYNVEKREQRVFAHGVHRLLRNLARTVTGVSATTSAASLAIGGIGALMIVMGGARSSPATGPSATCCGTCCSPGWWSRRSCRSPPSAPRLPRRSPGSTGFARFSALPPRSTRTPRASRWGRSPATLFSTGSPSPTPRGCRC